MLNISRTSAEVVAAEFKESVQSLDTALLGQLRLCASLLEVNQEVMLPLATSQPILRHLTKSMDGLLENRAHLMAVVGKLTVMQGHSNLDTVSFGCPGGLPDKIVKLSGEKTEMVPSNQG
jgi:hypothetical protein